MTEEEFEEGNALINEFCSNVLNIELHPLYSIAIQSSWEAMMDICSKMLELPESGTEEYSPCVHSIYNSLLDFSKEDVFASIVDFVELYNQNQEK